VLSRQTSLFHQFDKHPKSENSTCVRIKLFEDFKGIEFSQVFHQSYIKILALFDKHEKLADTFFEL